MGWLKSSRADWRNFFRLGAQEKRLLVVATLMLPMVAVAHRFLGLRRVQVALDHFSPKLRTNDRLTPECHRYGVRAARMIQLASRRGFCRATCLQQSVYLRWLLARRGIEAHLRIGVRKRAGRFEAHAWVEVLGQALNDTGDVSLRFAPFPRLLPAAAESGK